MAKLKYTPPCLTVVTLRNERGYAASDSGLGSLANRIDETLNEQLRQFEEVQELSGYNTGDPMDDGLAAGYFYEGQTEGWF